MPEGGPCQVGNRLACFAAEHHKLLPRRCRFSRLRAGDGSSRVGCPHDPIVRVSLLCSTARLARERHLFNLARFDG